MCGLTDTVRWRAERSVRAVLVSGVPLDDVVEATLLAKPIPCGISDKGIEWSWTQEWTSRTSTDHDPSVRDFVKDNATESKTTSRQQLETLLHALHRKTTSDNPQWVGVVDEKIIDFVCLDIPAVKPSDDWQVVFSRAYMHAFCRVWESARKDDGRTASTRFRDLGSYLASHLYAVGQITALRRTLKKTGQLEERRLLQEFWTERIHRYDQWLGFAIGSTYEPEWYAAAQSGDIDAYWRSINDTQRTPKINQER